MKTIGIIGGIGPESTVDYYKRIIEAYRIEGSLAAPEKQSADGKDILN